MPRQWLREVFRRRGRIARYAAADLIIAVSDDVAAAIWRTLPNARILVSQDPVITARFLDGANKSVALPWADSGIPLVLGVGRLALAKDFPTLLRAFALLRANRPARLAIVGGGSPRERRSLLRLARKLAIEADFVLPGETDVVAAWFRHASVFVSSSLWEGTPGALIEALAMGCPAVATSSVGSAAQLLRGGELGTIVPAGDPRAMAEAIAAQLDHPPEKACLAAAAEPYREHRQAEDYLAAIDDCVRHFNRGGDRSAETS
jgi:glycosyltransferase involved in cell wall biosynthesis